MLTLSWPRLPTGSTHLIRAPVHAIGELEMHALRLVGISEDGTHLVLTDDGSDFVLPIDAALRSALRQDTGHHVLTGHRGGEPMSPVEVQALIRSGADAEEAAERAGWTVEKVRRYEGPILAERQHVARMAANARLRPKGPASGSPTLLDRVTRRLHERGVVMDDVEWDSWRSDDGQWVLELHFEESGRRHRASWSFTKSSMSVRPLDQEAVLLSDDDPDLFDVARDAAQHRESTPAQSSARFATSYTSDYSSATATPRPHVDEDSDLMATLRSTSRASTRRRGPRRTARDHEMHDATLMEPTATFDSSTEPESLPVSPLADPALEQMADPAEVSLPVVRTDALADAPQPVTETPAPAPAAENVAETIAATPALEVDDSDDLGDSADETDTDIDDAPVAVVVAQTVDVVAQTVDVEEDVTADADAESTSLVHDAAAPEIGEDGLLLDPAADVENSENPRSLAGHDEPHLPFEDASPEFSAAPPASGDLPVSEQPESEPEPAEWSADESAPDAGEVVADEATPAVAAAPEAPAPASEAAPKPAASTDAAPRTRTRRRSSTTRKKTAAAQPAGSAASGTQSTQGTSGAQDDAAPAPTKISPKRVVAPAGTPEGSAPASAAPAAAPSAAPKPAAPKPAAPKPAASKSSRRKGRASVPAWDDIMFGAKPGDEG